MMIIELIAVIEGSVFPLFTYDYVQKEFLRCGAEVGYNYCYCSPPPKWNGVGSGLMILSKHKLVDTEYVDLQSDVLVNPGMIKAGCIYKRKKNQYNVCTSFGTDDT